MSPITTAFNRIRSRLAAAFERRPGLKLAGLTAFAALAIAGGVLVARPAAADWIGDIVVGIVGFICEILIDFMGQILLIVIGVLINVAQYNDFAKSAVVGDGWVIIRDVCNMFFIVVLLVMAFGTILGVEAWSIKGGRLTRLLLMAIVINFSRTLCGLMIDMGQVIMLTFVSGFKSAAGGNFIEALGINKLLSESENPNVSATGIIISFLLALAMVAISLGVVLMMTVMLIVRIVYLWILIILSPAAFFLKSVPGGQASEAYSLWWRKFTSSVVVGPVLAFFLWLSLLSVQKNQLTQGFNLGGTGETISDEVSAAFGSATIQSFMVAVILLMGGYTISQEIGGAVSGISKKLMAPAQKFAMKAARQIGHYGWSATKGTAKLAGGGMQFAYNKTPSIIGRRDPTTGKRIGIAGEVKGLTQKIKDSRIARFVSKEGRDIRGMERQAAALRATGQEHKAVAIDGEIQKRGAEDFKKRYNKDQLRGIFQSDKASASDRQKAMFAMAQTGDDMLGNNAGNIGAMVSQVQGGKGLEFQVRTALKNFGYKDAFLGFTQKAEKDIEDANRRGDKIEMKQLYTGVQAGVGVGLDGQMIQPDALTKLMGLRRENFDSGIMTDGQRNEITDALLLAAENLKSMGRTKEAEAARGKLAELKPNLDSGVEMQLIARGGELKFKQDEALLAKRVAAAEKGKLPLTDWDRQTKGALAARGGESRRGMERVDALRDRLVAGEAVDPAEISGVLDGLKAAVSDIEVGRKADGSVLRGGEALDASRFAADMGSAMSAVRRGDDRGLKSAADYLKIAGIALRDAAGLTKETKRAASTLPTIDRGRSAMRAADRTLGAVEATVDNNARATAVKKGLNQIKTAFKEFDLAKRAVPEPTKEKIEVVKTITAKLEGRVSIGEDEVAILKDLMTRMRELKDLL